MLAALNLVFAYLTFPETLPQAARRPLRWRAVNPFNALRAAFALPGLSRLLLVLALFHVADNIYPALWAFWGDAAFGWSPAMIGVTLATYGCAMAVVQSTLVGPAVKHAGEMQVARWGCALGAIAAPGFALVDQGWMVFPLIVFAALADLVPPALTGLLSQRTSTDEQGTLQGVSSAITALCAVIAPPIATTAFYLASSPENASPLSGAPYLISVALLLSATWRLRRL